MTRPDLEKMDVCAVFLGEPAATELRKVIAYAKKLEAVVEAVKIDHDQSIGPEEHEEGEKRWWKLPATRAALDELESSCP